MEEVVAQTQHESDNDDDEIKERREAEFERATMTRKQAEFTVKLQVNSPPTNLSKVHCLSQGFRVEHSVCYIHMN